MKQPRRLKNGTYIFKGYPKFTPNLNPKEIFQLGSFGGTYWRPIYSSITNKDLTNQHMKYPKSWWKDIPDTYLINNWNDYDKSINKYNKKYPHSKIGKKKNGLLKQINMVGCNGIVIFFKVCDVLMTNVKLLVGQV